MRRTVGEVLQNWYRIVMLLGHVGMSRVYLARCLRTNEGSGRQGYARSLCQRFPPDGALQPRGPGCTRG